MRMVDASVVKRREESLEYATHFVCSTVYFPHPGPLPRGEGEWSTASQSRPGRSLPNDYRLNTNRTPAVPSPCRRRAGAALWRAAKAEGREGQGEGGTKRSPSHGPISKEPVQASLGRDARHNLRLTVYVAAHFRFAFPGRWH